MCHPVRNSQVHRERRGPRRRRVDRQTSGFHRRAGRRRGPPLRLRRPPHLATRNGQLLRDRPRDRPVGGTGRSQRGYPRRVCGQLRRGCGFGIPACWQKLILACASLVLPFSERVRRVSIAAGARDDTSSAWFAGLKPGAYISDEAVGAHGRWFGGLLCRASNRNQLLLCGLGAAIPGLT